MNEQIQNYNFNLDIFYIYKILYRDIDIYLFKLFNFHNI